jgi:predicted acylesterase/phospholipase RssA
MSPEGFLSFPETFGIDNGSHLVKFLESTTKVALKLDPTVTFADFKGLYSFRCWATDLTTRTIREFSALKTPTVKIIDALRASMALPLYFTPLTDPITGNILSDGGIQGNLPLHHLTEDECGESLSIGFSSSNTDESSKKPIGDLMGFVNAMFACLTHGRNDAKLTKWAHRIIRIPVDDYPSWNFEASRADREMLLSKGRLAAIAWLKEPMNYITVKNAKVLRRHSL